MLTLVPPMQSNPETFGMPPEVTINAMADQLLAGVYAHVSKRIGDKAVNSLFGDNPFKVKPAEAINQLPALDEITAPTFAEHSVFAEKNQISFVAKKNIGPVATAVMAMDHYLGSLFVAEQTKPKSNIFGSEEDKTEDYALAA